MIAVYSSEDKLYGCPNCGCDTWIRDSCFRGDQPGGTCRSCDLHYQILADGAKPEVKFGTNRKDENGEAIYELATVVKHPRKGIPCWHWEAPDVRPEEGEYWNSRGIGYDLSGFVKSKQAGERLLEIVKKVLDNSEPKSWLDYRPSEPEWIQFKFNGEEFNLKQLDQMARDNKNILTEQILLACKL